jgi:hypothetical protein
MTTKQQADLMESKRDLEEGSEREFYKSLPTDKSSHDFDALKKC